MQSPSAWSPTSATAGTPSPTPSSGTRSLGGAEAKSARVADAREAFERAAESARRLNNADSLVGAAIGIAMMSDAGRLDEKLLTLLDEALERIGPERSARRAALLSAKSAE